ncbi:glycoside hydrolase family 32 protein [Acidicapsa ligni]|uniref:glycoside hydrolase family 32 protein n=1 Tax=Acidicapsa ligni TaxID=542300 RepID=UPI0021DFA5C6|nr:glycoside hydrolase family 32 protein [Acidicapsa ligni]
MKINRRKFLSTTATTAATLAALNSVLPAHLAQAFEEAAKPSPAFLAPASLAPASLAKDPRRPQYHLLPARNWMNDPNGPIFWKGHYHMFFQYNPNAAIWGDMHWAHAISPDMLHWKHLPIALAPTPGGPDADGCFSGTAVVNNGVPTFIYTGVQKSETDATLHDGKNSLRETQLYATSSDPELRTWTKRATPVIATPPPGMEVTGFRDPSPWLQDGTWYMAVGSGIKGKGGAVLLYKSADLQTWEYQHILTSHDARTGTKNTLSNPVDSGDMWECPDFFPLGDKHVLIYSTQGKVFWETGELDKKEMLFHPQQSGMLDYGSFYAPKTQLDKSGNRILWGWIQEARPEAEYSASGWAGLMSLPRVLTLGPDSRLKVTVAPIAEKLRQHEQKLHFPSSANSQGAATGQQLSSQRLKNACGEILLNIHPGKEPFSLDLLIPGIPVAPAKTHADPAEAQEDPSTAPETSAGAIADQPSLLSIRYSHANAKELVVDQQRMPINLAAGEPLELRFYIDGSVIELFVNNQTTCTKRFYYPGPTAPEIALSFTGNTADVARLSLWQLSPISKDRLTT